MALRRSRTSVGQEKENGGHIPIVAMTAHALVGDRDLCRSRMDGYVSKPLDSQKLMDCIDLAVSRKPGEIPARTARPTMPAPLLDSATTNVIDEVMLDKLVGGDTALLRELTVFTFEDQPQVDRGDESGHLNSDAKKLRYAAHALKGAVSNFAAIPALQACAALEHIGGNGKLSDAGFSARVELSNIWMHFMRSSRPWLPPKRREHRNQLQQIAITRKGLPEPSRS